MTEPTVVPSLFAKDVHEGIKNYLAEFTPYMPLQVDNKEFIRFSINDLPFFYELHVQLAEYASEQFKEKLKPSYSFLSLYQEGGTCPLHIDRPQCYRTIDYLIDQTSEEPWPIRIGEQMTDEELQKTSETSSLHPETKDEIEKVILSTKWHEVLLEPNDAVLYSGTHSWHYRPTKLAGMASLVFWHFVKDNFDGSLQ